MYFDRFDICIAYDLFRYEHNGSEYAEKIEGQLHRVGFKNSIMFGYTLRYMLERDEYANAVEIYRNLVSKYWKDRCMRCDRIRHTIRGYDA